MGCGARPVACDTTGLHFTADLVVDSRGRAYMLEAHVTLGVKAYGCALRRESKIKYFSHRNKEV